MDVRALNAFARWDEPNFFWHDVVGWKAKEPLALEPLKGAISIYQQHGFYFDAEGRLVNVLESLVS